MIYLDHAATTPLDPEVFKGMKPYFEKKFGNASSVHLFGQEASKGVEKARSLAADFLECASDEIIFTSCATESNNTVLKTVAGKLKREKGKNHIITTAIEHHCVLETAKFLEKNGFKITFLKVDKEGIVDLEEIKNSITDKTAIISVMYANNEIGTIQPIAEIGKIAKEKKVLFHTDAVQAANYLDCNVNKLNVDYLTLSAHKFYGPKGVGLLYKRKKAPLEPFLHGGAQEKGLRAGTYNVPGIVGLGKALELTKQQRENRTQHCKKLQSKLIKEIENKIKDVKLNGHREKRLPNNVNMSFKYVEGESMLLNLDMEGIAVSTGSACSSGSLEPSHVLMAIGTSPELSHGSLRFTFGKDNTKKDVDKVLEVLPKIVERLRKLSPTAPR